MKKYNKYINNIDRVEFTINNSCTSRCRHCSEGKLPGTHVLEKDKAAKALEDISSVYKVQSIMTFGGEALIYPEAVCAIHKKAKECGIPLRQLITNGYFSKDKERIKEVAVKLQDSGVNDILLSVDCFHAEFISFEFVETFAKELCENYKGRFRLQPTWVVDENDDNKYNRETKKCLALFDGLGIDRNEGDAIFPEGNAVKNLGEFFEKKPLDMSFKCGDALYSTELDNLDEIMIDCNGDVIPCNFAIGNIYKDDVLNILKEYDPNANIYTKALLDSGIKGLLSMAEKKGIHVDISDCYSPCAVCRKISRIVENK